MQRKRGQATSIPKRLVVEYEDGSTSRIDFNKLSRSSQLEISRAGAHSSSPMRYSEKYLLMEWRDGWREVVAVKGDSIELLRYYVIQRIEEEGRLSVEVGTPYPQLLVINRTPRDLNGLLVVGNERAKYYELESEVETREGVFEAGGKKEYVKYDKTDEKYPQESREGAARLAGLMNSLESQLNEKGLSAEEMLARDRSTKTKEYAEIALRMGIRGKEMQQDVYGFIELMVTRLAASRG
jgi:hypothetical protein